MVALLLSQWFLFQMISRLLLELYIPHRLLLFVCRYITRIGFFHRIQCIDIYIRAKVFSRGTRKYMVENSVCNFEKEIYMTCTSKNILISDGTTCTDVHGRMTRKRDNILLIVHENYTIQQLVGFDQSFVYQYFDGLRAHNVCSNV